MARQQIAGQGQAALINPWWRVQVVVAYGRFVSTRFTPCYGLLIKVVNGKEHRRGDREMMREQGGWRRTPMGSQLAT